MKKAQETNSPIFFADQTFLAVENPTTERLPSVTTFDVFKNGTLYLKELVLEAAGPFQQKNVATVLQAWELLGAMPQVFPGFQQTTLRTGLLELKKRTRFIGRWEIIGQNPTILCDSAHNQAGLTVAFQRINTLNFNKLHVVTGFVNDK